MRGAALSTAAVVLALSLPAQAAKKKSAPPAAVPAASPAPAPPPAPPPPPPASPAPAPAIQAEAPPPAIPQDHPVFGLASVGPRIPLQGAPIAPNATVGAGIQVYAADAFRLEALAPLSVWTTGAKNTFSFFGQGFTASYQLTAVELVPSTRLVLPLIKGLELYAGIGLGFLVGWTRTGLTFQGGTVQAIDAAVFDFTVGASLALSDRFRLFLEPLELEGIFGAGAPGTAAVPGLGQVPTQQNSGSLATIGLSLGGSYRF